jgi:hypothetical protein
MGGNRVLKRQRMQAEFVTQMTDGLAVGRFQFDPDEAIRLADVIADVVKRNHPGVGILEEQAVDDGLRNWKRVLILVHAACAYSKPAHAGCRLRDGRQVADRSGKHRDGKVHSAGDKNAIQ